MAGGSDGYRAALVRRQLTPGLISSLPGTAGLPPFISFSTSYPELDSAVRRPMRRIGHGDWFISESKQESPHQRSFPLLYEQLAKGCCEIGISSFLLVLLMNTCSISLVLSRLKRLPF